MRPRSLAPSDAHEDAGLKGAIQDAASGGSGSERELERDPLATHEPGAWDRLLESIGPASMLVWIQSRMSPWLLERLTPEDVWQETLLQAWRDHERFVWRGRRAFRRWLLEIAEHRIRDLVDREHAAKRAGGNSALPLSPLSSESSASSSVFGDFGPVASTTPSQVAVFREQAEAMRAALEALDRELREVVHLRLFEDLTHEEVAARLGISPRSAKHRFRRGVAEYSRRIAKDPRNHAARLR